MRFFLQLADICMLLVVLVYILVFSLRGRKSNTQHLLHDVDAKYFIHSFPVSLLTVW